MRKLSNRTNAKFAQEVKTAPKRISSTNTKGNVSLSSTHVDRMGVITSTLTKPSIIHTEEVPQTMVDNNEIFTNATSEINLDYIKSITTDRGVKHFSEKEEASCYSLDDNAMALVAICEHYELTKDEADLGYLTIYFNFIKHCLQPKGYFFKLVDAKGNFTDENDTVNLAESNGRAIWALGYMISKSHVLPAELISAAEATFQDALLNVKKIHSTVAIAYVIKGLYYRNLKHETIEGVWLIKQFANRLVQLYREVENENWKWFQSFLSLDNSIIPESLLCAWLTTGEPVYKAIAKTSFDFLLSKKIKENASDNADDSIAPVIDSEHSIEIANVIFALGNFYNVFKDESYLSKMKQALNWFLGKNKYNQVVYNTFTGCCYDTLAEKLVAINQRVDATVNYFAASVQIKKYSEKVINKYLTPINTFQQKLA